MLDDLGNMHTFAQAIVKWYEESHRRLPWRETKDPYRILVSETMLQQTRVDTVIPYYHLFLSQFPDIQTLAMATEDEVLKAWQGLGYYRRAKNLQRAAQMCVEEYGGCIPNDADGVANLPGVGPYTTGAIMSIAFDKPVAAVDGNVLRVLARILGLTEPIDTPAVKNEITRYMQSAVECAVPSLFTQSVMELGAVVCTPRNAQCLICPLSERCVAKRDGLVDELPKKRQKKKRRQIDVLAFWLEIDGALVLERRSPSGLLANMWQLPAIEYENYSSLSSIQRKGVADAGLQSLLSASTRSRTHSLPTELVREAKVDDLQRNQVELNEVESLIHFAEIDTERHIFTHLEWDVHVLRPVGLDLSHLHQIPLCGLSAKELPSKRLHRVPIQRLPELAWPKVYEKVIYNLLEVDVRN